MRGKGRLNESMKFEYDVGVGSVLLGRKALTRALNPGPGMPVRSQACPGSRKL